MLIVAPIVILVIGVFVSTIVNMTGSVLNTRSANALSYNIQNTLDMIELDVRLSGGYLASNSIALQTGQGYDDATAAFDNASATTGEMLILNTYATTGNPSSSAKNYIYASGQPNACSSPTVNQNSPVMFNIVYFVKNNTLWRRVIAPSNYSTVGCKTPWQKPTCSPGYSAAFCQAEDTRLVDGVQTSGFDVRYYTKTNSTSEIANASNNGLSDFTRQAALNTASTVNVSITATGTIAGRDINRSGQMRANSQNDNTVSQIITTQPSDTAVNAGSNAGFTAASSGAGATVQWQQSTNNGGSWSNISGETSTTLTRTAVTTDMDGYQYRAVFTTGLDTVNSTAARLTVNLLSWTSLTLQNSWGNYNSGYQTAGYRKTTSGVVLLKGLILRSGTPAGGEIIGTLPVGFRPSGRLIFTASTSPNIGASISVGVDGSITYLTGSGSWLSLENIRFVPDTGRYSVTPINALKSGWGWYGGGWATGSYVVDDLGRVNMQGLLEPGTRYDGAQIFDMPSSLLPAKYMHMTTYACCDFGALGIHYSGSGASVVDKNVGSANISMNMIYYPYTYGSWNSLTLQNSWAWYDGGGGIFSTPQYTKGADGLVSIKGLIRSGTIGATIATLPAGYRPAARILLAAYSNAAYARLDIDASGNIIASTGSNAWYSLDGINFYADQ
jgi:hypothetical protein